MEQASDGAETAAIDGLFRRDLKTFLFQKNKGYTVFKVIQGH